MAKKPKTQSKVTGKHLDELMEALSDDIGGSLSVMFTDIRSLVAPEVRSRQFNESNPIICQVKDGTIQFLDENGFVSHQMDSEVWQTTLDFELEELNAFLLDGVLNVLKERGVIA